MQFRCRKVIALVMLSYGMAGSCTFANAGKLGSVPALDVNDRIQQPHVASSSHFAAAPEVSAWRGWPSSSGHSFGLDTGGAGNRSPVSILVLEFQQHDVWFELSVPPGVSQDWVLTEARRRSADAGQHWRLSLVEPQPAIGAVVLVATRGSEQKFSHVPVCIHILRVPHVPFVAFLDTSASVYDVRLLLGDAFLPGDRVCLGEAPYAHAEDEYFKPRPGMLIRVVPEGVRIFPLRSLQFKLEAPWWRLRQKIPQDDTVRHGYGVAFVLARCRPACLVGIPSGLPPVGVKARILEAFDFALPDFDAIPVRAPIRRVSVLGRPAGHGFMLFPRGKEPMIPIAVDGRALGFGVRLLLIEPGRCSLERLLGLCMIPCLSGFVWHVEGSVFFDPHSRTFFLRRADTVVLRDGRLRVGRAACGDVESPACALRQRTGKDHTADQVARAVRVADKLRMAEQLLASTVDYTPVVYRTNDVILPPDLEVGRPVDVMPLDPDSPSEPSESPEVVDEVMRIGTRFVSFQTRPRLWTAWYQYGESVASFLSRVGILVDASERGTSLAAAEVQSMAGVLTILSFPTWWEQAGMSPVLMVSDDDAESYVQVADAELRAVDLVSEAYFVGGRRLDVYATFEDPPDGGAADSPPVPGSCVCFQREGAPRPNFNNALDQLRHARHVEADAMPGNVYAPEDGLILVLGLRFEQFLVTQRRDRWQDDVADALQMHPGDVWFHEQARQCDGVAVRSRIPARVVAVKSMRVFGRDPAGCGIFLDGRSAGVPICYRACFARRLAAVDVARMLEVEAPPGFEPTISCEGVMAMEHETLAVEHGANFVFWLSFFQTDSSSSLSEPHDGSGQDGQPDPDGSHGSDHGGADGNDGGSFGGDAVAGGPSESRSRSPRRSHELVDVLDKESLAVQAVRCVATLCRRTPGRDFLGLAEAAGALQRYRGCLVCMTMH